MDKILPAVRALIPLLFGVLAAFGVELSPELKQVVEDNLVAILVAFGALAAAFPSLRAAVKFKKDAK